jgi:Flp pilus assembly CpaE family ATPase
MSAHSSPTVRVACGDPILLDQVIRHLEEIPQWRLLASAHSAHEVFSAVGPPVDFLIVSDTVAAVLAEDARARPISAEVIVFGRVENAGTLRAALKLGARDFVLWPDDQRRLREIVERQTTAPTISDQASLGALHAIWAPKGGSGASVVAAHLSAAMATLGAKCTLMDLDLAHADQTAILAAEDEKKSILDLLRVADELSPSMMGSVAWAHPDGFRAILGPDTSGRGAPVEAVNVKKVVSTVRETADHVVADLPSGMGELTMGLLKEASTVILVVTPDLLSLRRARDAFVALRAAGVDPTGFLGVLNQAGGVDVSEKDLSSVLGLTTTFRVKADMQVYRAANRGELSLAGKRMLVPVARMLRDRVPSREASAIPMPPAGVGRERRVPAPSPAAPKREGRTTTPVPGGTPKPTTQVGAASVVRVVRASSKWRA